MIKQNKGLKKRLFVLMIAAILLFSACGGNSADNKDKDADPKATAEVGKEVGKSGDGMFGMHANLSDTFNPYTSKAVENRLVCQLIFDNVYDLDENYKLSSRIVTEAVPTKGGASWTFKIDNTIMMHDGEPLSAKDVAYSISLASGSARYGGRFLNYGGAFAAGDDTVIVALTKPNNMFPYLLNVPIIKYGSYKEARPAGSGAYKFAEDGASLDAFASYKEAEKLPFDKVYLREYPNIESQITAFEDSEIDIVTNDRTSKNNLGYGGNNEIRSLTTTNLHFFGFNMKSKFVQDPSYRYAMQLAVDREHAAKVAMNGNAVAAPLPVLPKSPFFHQQLAKSVGYNMEKCQQVFHNLEVRDHDNDGKLEYLITGIPIEIDINLIVCVESAGKGDIAKKFAEDMREMGITVTVKELSWNDYIQALTDGEFDMYYGEIIIPADFNLTKMLEAESPLNYGLFDDAELIGFIDEYLAAGDDTRADKCYNMLNALIQKSPIIPICFERREVIMHRNVFSGVNPSLGNVFLGITEWKMH
ncbi:MAG: ABC transporter substrate-binding protein [Ruminococcaceae bacterium]|nr:ABC transporter substrate-binding protein [Oscillospiraceae bacterium]